MLHDPFLFGPAARCHQERTYFPGWVLNPAEVSPELAGQSPSYGPAEYGPAGQGRLETLSGRLGRRKGVGGPKKERRRTESINSAFAELRECIPNVPADTKLSKIKTLRLATSYIAYLMEVLAKDSQPGDTEGFKAELKKADGRENKRKRETVRDGPGPRCPALPGAGSGWGKPRGWGGGKRNLKYFAAPLEAFFFFPNLKIIIKKTTRGGHLGGEKPSPRSRAGSRALFPTDKPPGPAGSSFPSPGRFPGTSGCCFGARAAASLPAAAGGMGVVGTPPSQKKNKQLFYPRGDKSRWEPRVGRKVRAARDHRSAPDRSFLPPPLPISSPAAARGLLAAFGPRREEAEGPDGLAPAGLGSGTEPLRAAPTALPYPPPPSRSPLHVQCRRRARPGSRSPSRLPEPIQAQGAGTRPGSPRREGCSAGDKRKAP